jgi:putative hydrolase of the HAD superfamily
MPIPLFCLLDLDDTILDYDSTGSACWNKYYANYAVKLGVREESLRQAIEESRRWYWSDMRRHRFGRMHQLVARRAILHRAFYSLGLHCPDVAEEFAEAFTREREEWIRPFPKAIQALEAMSASGARMALVTNGQASQQQAKIERYQLARFFEIIWIEGERGIGKPEPIVFQTILAGLRAKPQEAWMIGDDLRFDISPARAVGMCTAWIDIGRDMPDEVEWDLRAPSLIDLSHQWNPAVRGKG